MSPTRSILVVEEDAPTRAFLADNLTADGYLVTVAADKPAALERLAAETPHLVVCDINGRTLELLDAVRRPDSLASRVDPAVPLIVLTRYRDELARVRCLEHGCDDVLTKPFSYAELRGRIRAVLRRSYDRAPGPAIIVGPLRIEPGARTVHLGGAPVTMPGKEYALLVYLAQAPTRVFTKRELLRDVWGYRTITSRTLDAHAVRLRRRLRDIDGGAWISNVWGVGYRLLPVDPRENSTKQAAA